MKIDKSLKEVWAWKDKVYNTTKGRSVKESAKQIHHDVENIRRRYHIKVKKNTLV